MLNIRTSAASAFLLPMATRRVRANTCGSAFSRTRLLLTIVPLLLPLATAQAVGLNDTGIDYCVDSTTYSDISSTADCAAVVAAGGPFVFQDAIHGRDAAAAAGQLSKVGGGEAGFDFTALDASGQPTTPATGATPHPCVRDNLTGLVWEVKTDDGGLRDKDWTYTWYDSVHNYGGNPGAASGGDCLTSGRCDTEKYVADVNAAGLCGYSDWRMPTIKELEGIAHLGRTPRIEATFDATYFPNTPYLVDSKYSSYWSATPVAGASANARSISGGSVYNSAARTSKGSVRLVRGAAPTTEASASCTDPTIPASNPDSAYVDHGDGTVTDTRTGLMWKRCSEGQSWSDDTCTGTAASDYWYGSLLPAAGTGFAGHADWRLPNIKELRSLVEECRVNPAINIAVFPNTPSDEYWSGSVFRHIQGLSYYGRYVQFGSGNSSYGGGNIIVVGPIRLVRSGGPFASFSLSGANMAASRLTVAKQGSGFGTVTSNPIGIVCGAVCAADFSAGVTLTATAAANSRFVGWGGACSGTGSCTVGMTAAQNVTADFALDLLPGWNLLGNGVEAPLGVAANFNDPAKVATVWKWVVAGGTAGISYPAWAFYSPLLADGGQVYAASHAYEFLGSVNAGEGYWVNAQTRFPAPAPSATAVQSSSFMPATAGGARALPRGWSLIATGDGPTPAQFNEAIATSFSTAAAGQVPTNLTTLWAWDAARKGWYLWAPSLVNDGRLAAYLADKGLFDFATLPGTPNGTLSPATGFWVNMP